MLLGVVGTGCSTSVNGVNLGSRQHVNGVFNWANSVTNSAASAIGLHNFREGVKTVKLDSLIARVCTGKEASSALQTLVFVDDGGEELILCHLLNRRDVLQLGADELRE